MAYVNAVNNLEKVAAILSPQLPPDDRATLQFNMFTLKMMPYYTGIEPHKKEIR
jgi:hypothetical protein